MGPPYRMGRIQQWHNAHDARSRRAFEGEMPTNETPDKTKEKSQAGNASLTSDGLQNKEFTFCVEYTFPANYEPLYPYKPDKDKGPQPRPELVGNPGYVGNSGIYLFGTSEVQIYDESWIATGPSETIPTTPPTKPGGKPGYVSSPGVEAGSSGSAPVNTLLSGLFYDQPVPQAFFNEDGNLHGHNKARGKPNIICVHYKPGKCGGAGTVTVSVMR